jgi:Fanconi-associated nuclease 1
VPYAYARTRDIWPARADLLAYERALELDAQVDALLDGSALAAVGKRGRSSTATPRKGRAPPTQAPAPDEPVLSPRQQAAQEVIALVDTILPAWRDLVRVKGDAAPRPGGLARFEAGHVLTRVVAKGATARGTLQDFDGEDALLAELLAQSRWRRGRRGRAWDRRITLATKAPHRTDAGRARALVLVEDALRDPDTPLCTHVRTRVGGG